MNRGDRVRLEIHGPAGVWRDEATVVAWSDGRAILEVPDQVQPAGRGRSPAGLKMPRRRYGVDFRPVRPGTAVRITGSHPPDVLGRAYAAQVVKGYGPRLSVTTVIDAPNEEPAPSEEGAGVAPPSRDGADG